MPSARERQYSFRDAGFFVCRTPLLPIDDLLEWSTGLQAPCISGKPDLIASASEADRKLLRTRLAAIVARPAVLEALYISSPSLVAALDAWKRDPEGPRGRRVEASLVRYFQRMASRPTPFGLFAGFSVGVIGAATECVLEGFSAYRRRTRLSIEYLREAVSALSRLDDNWLCLDFHVNSSAHRIAGRLHYVRGHTENGTRSYRLVAVGLSPHLEAALSCAERGATPSEIAQGITAADGETTFNDALRFVREMVNAEILVSTLDPPVTGRDGIHYVLDMLEQRRALPAISKVATELAATADAFDELDSKGLGSSPESYQSIVHRLPLLPDSVDESQLFQVDLHKPASVLTLGADVVAELIQGCELLHRVGHRDWADSLQTFREAFVRRFGDAEVPLADALDEEVGIGFGRSDILAVEPSPLLEAITWPRQDTATISWGARERLLLRLMDRSGCNSNGSVELTDNDLAALKGDQQPRRLPDAIAIVATVVADGADAVVRGDYQLLIEGGAGPSGARMFGRACHASQTLHQAVVSHLRAEEALADDAVFAEVVYAPEGRLGKVVCRPVLRGYEIPYLARSGADTEHQIPISDLRVSVRGGYIYLRSARLNREVIPRLTSAHNFSMFGLGAYKFLCALQNQQSAPGVAWSWGPLEDRSFLPRVVYKRLILSRASWRVEGQELQSLASASRSALFEVTQRWRMERGMPRLVALRVSDMELVVDFDNILSIDAFVAEAKQREFARLFEVHPKCDRFWSKGPEGHFVHQLVVPLLRETAANAQATRLEHKSTAGGTRAFLPGSEWLYAKLYCGTATADEVLRRVVGPVVRRAIEAGVADRWFFIRYADPDPHLRVRIHGVPERLLDRVLADISESARPLRDAGYLWRVQVDTYEREVERYGGDEGVVLAEQLFHADSEAVLKLIEDNQATVLAKERAWAALCAVDRLLSDLGLPPGDKVTVLTMHQSMLAREFGMEEGLRGKLSSQYRKHSRQAESALAGLSNGSGALPMLRDALNLRSARLVPITRRLRELEVQGRLSVPLMSLAASYVHMHVNRILRASQRSQELVLCHYLLRVWESREARRHHAARAGLAETGA